MKSYGVTIQLKRLQPLSHATIYKHVVEILWCYHSTEKSSVLLSHATIYKHVVLSLWMKSYGVTIQLKRLQ